MFSYRAKERLNNPELVVETLEASGLKRDTSLIIGGSVLAILGIRPACDVDVMIPRSLHEQLSLSSMTPTGWALEQKPNSIHDFIRTVSLNPDQSLPLDIVAAYDHDYPYENVDNEFIATIENFPEYAGYHYLPLEYVLDQKRQTKRKKDKYDTKLINAYMKQL